MKIERGLVGTILVALVVATLVSFFIFGERGGSFSIVKNEYAAAGRNRFSVGLSIFVKKPIGVLQISYFSLLNRTDLIEGFPRNTTGEQICGHIPNIRSFLDMSKDGFIRPEATTLYANIPIWETPDRLVEKRFKVYLYDFSKEAWAAIPPEIIHSRKRPVFGTVHLWDFYDIFACMFDEDDNLTYFYEGVADFYLNKVVSIDELTIQRNGQKKVYLGREGEIGPNSILYAPDRGVVRFDDLRRNDRIQILFSIDSTNRPSINGRWPVSMSQIVQIIQIKADGYAPQYLVNTVKPPKPVPKPTH